MADRDPFQFPDEAAEELTAAEDAVFPPKDELYSDELATDEQPASDGEAGVPDSAAPAEASAEDERKSWYIIHTYSGFENKVAESLRTRSEAFAFTEKLGQVLIPTEEVVEMRDGQKRKSER